MAKIDTSKRAYREIGIDLTEEQYEKLIDINHAMAADDFKAVPVHFLLLTLKCLGLLNQDTTCKTKEIGSKDKYQEPSKKERLENALLEYIEKNTKDTTPEIAATIPSVAMALVELWKG